MIQMYNSTMRVHVSSYQDRVVCGEFVNLSYRKKYFFHGLDQMLLMMEDIMDTVASPQAVYRYRALGENPYVFAETDALDCLDMMDRGSYLLLPRIQPTFSIRCKCRQHGSMQGELIAPGENGQKKISYRSALELLRLIYEYLDSELEHGNIGMNMVK